MIYTYGFSLTGISHMEKKMECQDAHRIKLLDNGWIIAAVADGVGSAANSAVGARTAVDTVVDFCAEYMPYDYNTVNIKSMLRTAFNYALKKIITLAGEQDNVLESYDTTLTVAIYDGSRLIYGHSGDGGILGLTANGDYIAITKPQKGGDNISVLPLRAGFTCWEIASYEEPLSALLLLTDGMLDALQPYLLRNREPKVYVPLAMFLMDYHCFEPKEEHRSRIDPIILDFLEGSLERENYYQHIHMALMNYRKTEEEANQIIESIRSMDYPMKLLSSVKDDKTVVGLINCDLPPKEKPTKLYLEPDWQQLQLEWSKAAYPLCYPESSVM